jgi:hypothetical protein
MPADRSYELDPKRPDGKNVEENAKSLSIIAQAFLNVICESAPILPPYAHFSRLAGCVRSFLASLLLVFYGRFATILLTQCTFVLSNLHNYISNAIGRNEFWPESSFPAVGSFMFLRYVIRQTMNNPLLVLIARIGSYAQRSFLLRWLTSSCLATMLEFGEV